MKELLKINTSLSVSRFYEMTKELLHLAPLAGTKGSNNREITDRAVNRPALALSGYFKHFVHTRLQYLGYCELSFLLDLDPDKQIEAISNINALKVPCFIVTNRTKLPISIVQLFEQLELPLFSTELTSVEFVEKATIFLDEYFSPSTTVSGTLIEINGCGVLLQGLPDNIKSTCIMALLERNYSLIADEIVCLNCAHNGYLTGSSKKLSFGFMEFKGVGLVKVSDLFGLRSIRAQSIIDLVIRFEDCQQLPTRSGLEENATCDLLGHQIPLIVLPNNIGNDAYRLIEVASSLHYLKRFGKNPAEELSQKLIQHMIEQK